MIRRVRISQHLVECGDCRTDERERRSRRAAMSKGKGGAFEREICRLFSLWVSGGQRIDLFWRSAMSGGRATRVRQLLDQLAVRQGGDITAVAPEGHSLTDECFIECKHHRDLGLRLLLLGRGPLTQFWTEAQRQAAIYGRAPMVVAKQNLFPTLVLTESRGPLFRAAERGALRRTVVRLEQDVYVFQLKDILEVPYAG